MSELPINYIITCGTSQLSDKKLTRKNNDKENGLGIDDKAATKLEIDFKKNLSFKKIFDKHIVTINNIQKGLRNRWSQLHGSTSFERNAFGAEINTLVGLVTQTNACQNMDDVSAHLREATYRVMVSDTSDGELAYWLLRWILTDLVKVPDPDDTIEKLPIANLKPSPDSRTDVNEAMRTLVNNLYKSITPGSRNLIIMTGGFKSVIPCLTMFALFNGLEMFYLFEESDFVQKLTPIVNPSQMKKETREKWRETWNNILTEGNVPQEHYEYEIIRKSIDLSRV